MIQFDKNTNPVFQETSEWLPDRFQSRDRFHSHESLYMRRVQSPQDLFVHHWQLFHCSVRLYGEGAGGGGGEGGDIFFMWKQLLLFFIDPPSGEGYRPSSDSAVPYLLPTQPFFVLSRNAPRHCERTQKNSWLQNHRTWVKKGIWTIVFVGLSLVTYWNSLCPRLEKWKLCR